MQSAAPPMPIPKRSRRRWYVVGGFAIAALATPFLYLLVSDNLRERELEQIYAEMDAEDPHWRWPDLLASMPPAPDDQNAFVQIRKVTGLLTKTPFTLPPAWYGGSKETALNMHNARLSEENSGILGTALKLLDPTLLPEARKLKDFPKGRIKFDHPMYPFEVNPGEIQHARELMNLLHHDVMMRAHDNDLESGVESWNALLNTSHAIEDSPFLIGQLVRIAGQRIAIGSLERLLGQGELSEADLARIQTLLKREVDDNPLYHGLRGERASSHQIYLDLRDGKITLSQMAGGKLSGLDHVFNAFPSILFKGYPEHLRLFNEHVKASKLTDEGRMEAMQKLEQKVLGNRNMITHLLMPATTKIAVSDQYSQAGLRCAMVAVAVERYRVKHEAWPRGFDDLLQEKLLKEIPTDPFDGKLLRFKRVPTGVIIYSVGIDKIDNQGKLGAMLRAPDTDFGFELWDRQLRAVAPPAEDEK